MLAWLLGEANADSVQSSFASAELIFKRAGIDVARPVHRPLHRYLGLDAENYPHSERLFLTALSLPLYPTLSLRDVARVASVARQL